VAQIFPFIRFAPVQQPWDAHCLAERANKRCAETEEGMKDKSFISLILSAAKAADGSKYETNI